MEKIEKYGLILEKEGKTIMAITSGSRTIKFGQEVVANGRFGAPAGTKGKVIKIYEPYTGGYTSDVIEVQFPGEICGTMMKFKDLEPYRYDPQFDLRPRRNLRR